MALEPAQHTDGKTYTESYRVGVVRDTSPKTIEFSGLARCIMVALAGTASRDGMWIVQGAADGVIYKEVTGSSAITLDTSTTGKLKLTSSVSQSVNVYLLVIVGSEYITVV